MTNNQINYARHKEDKRHNLVTESQGQQTIDENVRHNKVTEDIGYGNLSLGWANNALGYANLAENARHNQVAEGYQAQQIANQKDYWDASIQNQKDKNAIDAWKNPVSGLVYQTQQVLNEWGKGAGESIINKGKEFVNDAWYTFMPGATRYDMPFK